MLAWNNNSGNLTSKFNFRKNEAPIIRIVKHNNNNNNNNNKHNKDLQDAGLTET